MTTPEIALTSLDLEAHLLRGEPCGVPFSKLGMWIDTLVTRQRGLGFSVEYKECEWGWFALLTPYENQNRR